MLVHRMILFDGLWTGLPTISIIKDFFCSYGDKAEYNEDSESISATLELLNVIVP